MISCVILTYNEEKDIAKCIASLSWCDDIVVFDSFSNDKTVETASQIRNVRVVQHEFVDYATQRNAALKGVPYKYHWVLMVDADEEFNSELATRLFAAVKDPSNEDVSLFHLRRKDFFFGRWIRRSSGYPTWFGRLMKVGKVEVTRPINEIFETVGRKAFLPDHFIHYPFSKGVTHWIDKHNRYSSMEATSILETRSDFNIRHAFANDPTLRRKAAKGLLYRLPFRPWVVFFYLYIVRCGFLDGLPGFHFCRLRMWYEYMIDLKVREKKHQLKG
jgi:glycosyltransferase involved in cell wall biosynthesis